MIIHKLGSRIIFDSRGEETIEVELETSHGDLFRASVPAGKSTGSREAKVLPAAKAQKSVSRIARAISHENFTSLADLDSLLLTLDGTENKSHLGGNVLLGVSIAASRAFAAERGVELWEFLRKEFFGTVRGAKPLIFSNLINGGAHGHNNLSIQEYMVVAKPGASYGKTVALLIKMYRTLGAELSKKRGVPALPIGDEGGYSLQFKNNLEPIQMLEGVLRKLKLSGRFGIALDAAATNFSSGTKYRIDGKSLSREQLLALYASYRKKAKLLFSIEDPFGEMDVAGFAALHRKDHTLWIVGDDLTTTNPQSIGEAAEKSLVTAVIIKPNQIGTVTEACWAMNAARKRGIKTIVSHRSGETEDTFIVHLAKAGGADGLKIGAPTKERFVKFNELIRIFA